MLYKEKCKIMKKIISVAAGLLIGLLIFGAWLIYSPSSEAQKKYAVQWEYAAITFTAIPITAENQAVIVGVANVCYLQITGCQNEEIKAEVIYAKFIQDFRLENNGYTKSLAYNRAKDSAYTKAVAKLGLEGWEIIAAPPFSLDAYISDGQGSFSVVQGSKETKPNIYFKRLIQ